MSVMERIRSDAPVASVFEALHALIVEDDRGALGSLLDQLVDEAEQAIGTDVAAVALQRDRLDRIARRLESVEAGHRLEEFALGYLRKADHGLDRARTRMLGELARARRAEEAHGVRDRVLAALDRPRRPRDVADELGVDPSQVSRELRALAEQGRIVQTPPPPGASGDARAHWYAQAQPAAAI